MVAPLFNVEQTETQLSMGTATSGNAAQISNGDANSIFEQAYRSGIRYFDTSALYRGGIAEGRLGFFLQSFSNTDIRVSTKCGRYREHGAPPPHKGGTTDWCDFGYDATLRSVERRIMRLGIDHIGVHVLRRNPWIAPGVRCMQFFHPVTR